MGARLVRQLKPQTTLLNGLDWQRFLTRSRRSSAGGTCRSLPDRQPGALSRVNPRVACQSEASCTVPLHNPRA